jgi:hypothetical protein
VRGGKVAEGEAGERRQVKAMLVGDLLCLNETVAELI